jgi:hypothetical protein
VTTLGALDTRFELTVEEINEEGLFSLSEALPVFEADFCVGSVVAVFVLDIGLLGNSVDVFVERFEQDRQHFLRVMLCEASELPRLHRNYPLDIPRSQTSVSAPIHFLDELRKNHGELASGAVVVLLIDVQLMEAKQKVFGQWLRVCQALKHTVHETCVSEVL